MGKAVLLSIRPEWVEKIAKERKTVEIRKSYPKIATPFKCYIYCTMPKHEYEDYYLNGNIGYAWHISKLQIYDSPRELDGFKKVHRDCFYADLGLAKRDCPDCKNPGCFLQRPLQSWCYVEDLGNG